MKKGRVVQDLGVEGIRRQRGCRRAAAVVVHVQSPSNLLAEVEAGWPVANSADRTGVDALGPYPMQYELAQFVVTKHANPAHGNPETRQTDRQIALSATDRQREVGGVAEPPRAGWHHQRHRLARGDHSA